MNKKILLLFLIPAGIFFVLVLAVAAQSWWGGYQWQKQVDAWQANLRKPYLEDTYGGKTPEETWAMFLEALKKGDVELASKYFWPEKQVEFKQLLQNTKDQGNLQTWINQMENLRKSGNQSGAADQVYYSFEVYNVQLKQNLTERVVFILSPYTKIWKISLL